MKKLDILYQESSNRLAYLEKVSDHIDMKLAVVLVASLALSIAGTVMPLSSLYIAFLCLFYLLPQETNTGRHSDYTSIGESKMNYLELPEDTLKEQVIADLMHAGNQALERIEEKGGKLSLLTIMLFSVTFLEIAIRMYRLLW